MGDIGIPRSLSTADAALSMAESLVKLIDPKERQKIADDIEAFHALNDTEAKKADDARAMIKKNQDILDQTRQAEDRVVKSANELEQDKADFKTQADAEWAKINIAKGEAKDTLDAAQALRDQAVDIQNKTNQKESDLLQAKAEYQANVDKLAEEQKTLDKDRQDIEAFKQKVLAMEEEAKNKLATLKQFNF